MGLMKLNRKKYWILVPPFALAALTLLFYLPDDKKFYSILVILLFWLVYYGWEHFEKK